MGERIFFLSRVREGVSLEEAERFLRERDIPMGNSLQAITRYTVGRVDGWLFDDQGALPYDFIDAIDVTSVADYHQEIAELEGTPEWQQFVEEWGSHIGEVVAVYGRALE